MQECATFYVTGKDEASYKAIVKVVKDFFEQEEHRTPEYFNYWIADLKKDDENLTIRNDSDVHASDFDYSPLFSELVDYLKEKLPGHSFSGYYELYNDDWGPNGTDFEFDGNCLSLENNDEDNAYLDYAVDTFGGLKEVLNYALKDNNSDELIAFCNTLSKKMKEECEYDIYEETDFDENNVSLEAVIEMLEEVYSYFCGGGEGIFDDLGKMLKGFVSLASGINVKFEIPELVQEALDNSLSFDDEFDDEVFY